MTPILIPAKNIYKKQYEKLLDNIIELVQVKTKLYSTDTRDVSAYTESYEDTFQLSSQSFEDIDFQSGEVGANSGIYDRARAYAYIRPYTFAISKKIPKDDNKKQIMSLKDISFEVVCIVEKGKVTADSREIDTIENIQFGTPTTSFETITQFEFSESAYASTPNAFAGATATIPEYLSKTTFNVTEHEDYFNATIAFVCGTRRYDLTGINRFGETTKFSLEGTYENLIPQQININLNGIVKTISFTERIESFGDKSSKQAFVIGSDNDFLQEKSRYFAIEDENTLNGTYLAEKYAELLDEYKNGKKKLTLLCDINDYYYYDATKPDKKGSIAISRNLTRLTFKEYDEVIPMIKLANGDYVPIAKNEDGTPMVFVVLAIRVFYDGVVWQELTLQQK